MILIVLRYLFLCFLGLIYLIMYNFFFLLLIRVLVCFLVIEMLLAIDIFEVEFLKENVFEFNNWKRYFFYDG